jgi:hypothetical protein
VRGRTGNCDLAPSILRDQMGGKARLSKCSEDGTVATSFAGRLIAQANRLTERSPGGNLLNIIGYRFPCTPKLPRFLQL